MNQLRQLLRSLAKQPGFTIPAVVTIALSVGLTTAVFSALYAILLRPLPYPDAARLVLVWETDAHNSEARGGASLPDFRDWQAQSRSYAALSAFTEEDMTLSDARGGAERMAAAHVTHDLFSTLGVTPELGRGLTATDDHPTSARVALISDALWRSRFGANPAILGRTLQLESATFTVVGVMPPGFSFPHRTQIWTALEPVVKEFQRLRGVHSLAVLGRLANGVSAAAAQKEMEAIARRLELAYPADNAGRGVFVESLHDALVGNTRPMLLIVFGAALLVLLIGCANVAGLTFVRSGNRSREMSIRIALGASRAHVVRQIVSESLLVTAAGSIAGVALASWGVRALVALAPDTFPSKGDIAIHAPVLLFAIAAGTIATLIAGFVPAMTLTAGRHGGRIRGTAITADRDHRRSRRLLIIGELAVAVVLTIGAMLLLRSYGRLVHVDPGVSHLDLITANLRFPEGKYPTPSRKIYPQWPRLTQRYDDILTSYERLPGVRAVALALNHPLHAGWTSQMRVVGRPVNTGPQDEVRIRPVTAAYAQTVGLPLLQGREIERTDRPGAEPVVLVNEAMVRKYFPNGRALGEQIEFWGTNRRIVGIVGNERFLGLQSESEPALYPSLYQLPMNDIYVLLRSERPLTQMLPALRSALATIDPDIPLSDARTLEQILSLSVAPQRFTAVVITIFGALSLLLAAVGVFGLIAYQVTLRVRELGIRSALGAGRPDLLLLILREAAALSLTAVLVGWLAAVSLTRFLARILFGVTPLDPTTFVTAGIVLGAVGLAAAAVPALRASRVDPATALRAD